MADPTGKIVRLIARAPGALLAKTKITPNQVTVLGLLVNCVVAYLIGAGRVTFIAAGILIWVAGFFDALDGSVARATGRISVFGNFLDSVLDRYADSVIYLGILFYYLKAGSPDHVILVVVTIIGSMAVSYTRAKAESLSQKCEVGMMPRSVRIIILGASFCVSQVFWGLLIIAVFSHLTVVQRILKVHTDLHNE
ncbi:MAG: CDP-alcohol phosphatidyltransferase family protein [Candidatus Tantalella remota]|nr:CDP-alcohol phosphatidyltransferase family protein [Candidatus Tantalella remota]